MTTYDARACDLADDRRDEAHWDRFWEAAHCRRACCVQLPVRRLA